MITHKQLLETLSYDSATGEFTWKINVGTRARAGKPTGYVDADGYVRLVLYGRKYLAHRVAWFHVTGRWPRDQIDHVNLLRHDNRWVNLREASRSQNLGNIRVRCDNKVGRKGVCWHKAGGAWAAQIMKDGRKIHLGLFTRIEDAHAAYCAAADVYFKEFSHHG